MQQNITKRAAFLFFYQIICESINTHQNSKKTKAGLMQGKSVQSKTQTIPEKNLVSISIATIVFLLIMSVLISGSAVAAGEENFHASTPYKEMSMCQCTGGFSQNITIENTGIVPSMYFIEGKGISASWQNIPTELFVLLPGQSAIIPATITPECGAIGNYTLTTLIRTETNTQKEIRQKLNIMDCNGFDIRILSEINKENEGTIKTTDPKKNSELTKNNEMACNTKKEYLVEIYNQGMYNQKHRITAMPDYAQLAAQDIALPKNSTAITKLTIAPSCEEIKYILKNSNNTKAKAITARITTRTTLSAYEIIPTKNNKEDSIQLTIYPLEEAYKTGIRGPEKVYSDYRNSTLKYSVKNEGKFDATYKMQVQGEIASEQGIFHIALKPKQETTINIQLAPRDLAEGNYNLTIKANYEEYSESYTTTIMLREDPIIKITRIYDKEIRPKLKIMLTTILLLLLLILIIILIAIAKAKKKEKMLQRVLYGPRDEYATIKRDVISKELIATKEWRYIEKQKTMTMTVGDDRFEITKIKITTNKNAPRLKLNVRLRDALSEQEKKDEEKLPEKIYSRLSINKYGVNNKGVESVQIIFRVRKSWLKAEKINARNVSLYRINKKTEEYNGKQVGEDEVYRYYEATVPGLSRFVIGEKMGEAAKEPDYKIITRQNQPHYEKKQKKVEAKTKNNNKSNKWIVLTLILIALLILAFVLIKNIKTKSSEPTAQDKEIQELIDYAKKNNMDNTAYYQIWDKNSNRQVNLSNYFKSSTGSNVKFGTSNTVNITVLLNDGMMTLIPPKDWHGIEKVYIAASDGKEYFQDADMTMIVQNYEPTAWNNTKRAISKAWNELKENIGTIVFFILIIIVLVMVFKAFSRWAKEWKKDEESMKKRKKLGKK